MSEDKRVLDIVLDKLKSIENKIDKQGEELFERVRALELAHAENKGKIAVISALIGAGVALFLQWIGDKF